MKQSKILSVLAATALCGTVLHAQTPPPAAPAAPATPAATPAATPPAAAGAAATAPAAGTKKPYNTGDSQKLKAAAEALQFHMRMGEIAKYKKDDKEFAAIGTRIHKEGTDYYGPLVDMARAHNFPDKEIPNAVSASDKNAIEKLNKAKAEKWKLEYFELFAKEAKKNARTLDTAARTATDPDLKDWSMKLAKIMEGQAELLESEYKALKNPKKEVKK